MDVLARLALISEKHAVFAMNTQYEGDSESHANMNDGYSSNVRNTCKYVINKDMDPIVGYVACSPR